MLAAVETGVPRYPVTGVTAACQDRTGLPGGRYIAYVAAKGPLEVAAKTEIRSVVNIDVKPGETYYIRADIVPGAFVGNVILNQQSKELGAAQIAKCSLVPEKRQ